MGVVNKKAKSEFAATTTRYEIFPRGSFWVSLCTQKLLRDGL